jgi:hypothetical protein
MRNKPSPADIDLAINQAKLVDGSIRPMNRRVGNAYWRSQPVEPCAPSA